MNFDIAFIDATTPHPYDDQSPSLIGMGGTEKTVVAVAEGLSAIGFKVAVFQKPLDRALKGRAFYLPFDAMKDHSTKVCVALRGITGFEMFPEAKRVAWLHDMPSPKLHDHLETYIQNDVYIVAVSRYHKHQVLDYATRGGKTKDLKIRYIYNPVLPVEMGITKDKNYNKNNMVWASSPHKGLEHALELFSLVKNHIPELTLTVFNPGYIESKPLKDVKGVNILGSRPSHEVWGIMRNSLCVFYPSTFLETFGLVFAEANAVGCPVLAYEVGALPEVIRPHTQFIKQDTKDVVDRLKMWRSGGTPEVKGNKKFHLKEVLNQWLELLKRI